LVRVSGKARRSICEIAVNADDAFGRICIQNLDAARENDPNRYANAKIALKSASECSLSEAAVHNPCRGK
jgi:hypothetical protein